MDYYSDEKFECDGGGGKRVFPFGDAVGERESKRVAVEVCMDDAPRPLAGWGELGFQGGEDQLGELAGELPDPNTGWVMACQNFDPAQPGGQPSQYLSEPFSGMPPLLELGFGLGSWGEPGFQSSEDQLGWLAGELHAPDTGGMACQNFDTFSQGFHSAELGGQLPSEPFGGVPLLQQQGSGLGSWDDMRQDNLLGADVKVESGSTSVAAFSGVHSRVSRSPFGGEASASEAARENTSDQHDSANGASPMEVDGGEDNSGVPEQDYDTCFGVVIVRATLSASSTLPLSPDDPPLVVRPAGNIIRLCDAKDKLAGLLLSDSLISLVRMFSVHLTASFAPELSEDSTKTVVDRSKKPRKPELPTTKGLTRLVVYGLLSDKDGVGQHLSKAKLYLQHPKLIEYDKSAEYFNPHLLLRPGAKMPRIEDLRSDVEESVPAQTALNEVKRGRIWGIIDQADGGAVVPEVVPSPRLKSTLKEHQRVALEMMVERECGVIKGAKFPTLWTPPVSARFPKYKNKVTGYAEREPVGLHGGILADEMGLGKTLSTLALICCDLDAITDAEVGTPGESRTTLVVAPKSTLISWEVQIKSHIHTGMLKAVTYHGPSRYNRIHELPKADVVLTTYETLRQDFSSSETTATLYSHKWRRVVLDEGHRIRSRSSQLHQAALAVSEISRTRWCLTGTPVQNSLDDYGALLSFLHVRGLRDKRDFDRLITTPVENNQKESLERLRDLVIGTSLRRTIAHNSETLSLQARLEEVELVDLSHDDCELYRFFQQLSSSIASDSVKRKGKGKGKGGNGSGAGVGKGDDNILSLINFLRRICNYGERMLSVPALDAWRARDADAAGLQMRQPPRRICAGCEAWLQQSASVADSLPCGHEICSTCVLIRDEADDKTPGTDQCCSCQSLSRSELGTPSSEASHGRSAKVAALIRNLRTEQQPHQGRAQKSVVFSCWTKMLDLVQQDLRDEGFNVVRIDGQASLNQRWRAMAQFKENPSCTVMLASIGSVGEGVDLISACHVHILEPQWNPTTEAQAIGRVHRFGQKGRVTVTRYIVRKSIETYVQWIQADKLRLISKSIGNEKVSQGEVDAKRWEELRDCLSLDAVH